VVSARPRIGVLALQGDFREHITSLTELGAEVVPLRRPEEIGTLHGVVIPGGESSVMDKLSRAFGVAEPLSAAIRGGLPTYGTCAGMIMLSSRIAADIPGQQTLDVLDTTVRRNAFGSQNDSFETDIPMPALGDAPVHAVFIRAPVVEQHGPGVQVLGALPDGQVVAVQQENVIASAFHPEVAGEDRFHRRFLDLVRSA
jgi:pyridoxal 5'-phosphate synthase pdxT subunit